MWVRGYKEAAYWSNIYPTANLDVLEKNGNTGQTYKRTLAFLMVVVCGDTAGRVWVSFFVIHFVGDWGGVVQAPKHLQ